MEYRIIRSDVPDNIVASAKARIGRLKLGVRAVELIFNDRFDRVKVVGVDEHKILATINVNTEEERREPAGETAGAGHSIDEPASEQETLGEVQRGSRARNAPTDT